MNNPRETVTRIMKATLKINTFRRSLLKVVRNIDCDVILRVYLADNREINERLSTLAHKHPGGDVMEDGIHQG